MLHETGAGLEARTPGARLARETERRHTLPEAFDDFLAGRGDGRGHGDQHFGPRPVLDAREVEPDPRPRPRPADPDQIHEGLRRHGSEEGEGHVQVTGRHSAASNPGHDCGRRFRECRAVAFDRPQGKEQPQLAGRAVPSSAHGSSRPFNAATTVQRRTASRPPAKRYPAACTRVRPPCR